MALGVAGFPAGAGRRRTAAHSCWRSTGGAAGARTVALVGGRKSAWTPAISHPDGNATPPAAAKETPPPVRQEPAEPRATESRIRPTRSAPSLIPLLGRRVVKRDAIWRTLANRRNPANTRRVAGISRRDLFGPRASCRTATPSSSCHQPKRWLVRQDQTRPMGAARAALDQRRAQLQHSTLDGLDEKPSEERAEPQPGQTGQFAVYQHSAPRAIHSRAATRARASASGPGGAAPSTSREHLDPVHKPRSEPAARRGPRPECRPESLA